MIKKFFHSLNSCNISYLLISGQATVLYGAATFSEDIDLWIEPKIDNWNKFLRFLNKINAKIYKLTPPISMEFIKKGHGFHFQLISKENKPPNWFLDVMGVVPRAGNFTQCYEDANYQDTEWGKLPVIGIKDLVELKKTRRIEDYSVISNLVKIEYEGLSKKKINPNDWKWILTNSFQVEDILYYLNTNSLARHVGKYLKRSCMPYCLKAITSQKESEKYIESASKEIALEIEDFRQNDRKYWKSILEELKALKDKNQLLIPGSNPPESIK